MIQADGKKAVRSTADDHELRRFVEASLGTPLDELQRRPLHESTSFPCEILSTRSGERTVELFFKDFDSCALPRPSDEGPGREIEIYRRILDADVLGTPRHFGSLREGGRTWLLIERVRGARLAERGSALWTSSVAWLARLQAHGLALGVARDVPPYLAVHDADHLRATAEEAVRTVAQVDLLLERRLQTALEDYEATAEQLADQPRVLVHGSFRPENILVDSTSEPARIAPVDWEHGALGSALYDLAFLTAGLEREKAERLLGVFMDAAAEHGVPLPAAEEVPELLTILRLHKLLRSLGRSLSWSYSRETVEHLVVLAGRLGLDLRAARRRRTRARGPARAERADVADAHPALRAWRTLGLPESGPARVERIRGRFFGRKGRVVYRLGAIGPDGCKVVAKRSPRGTGELEHQVYSELLPELGVSAPRCFGGFSEGPSSWLFMEDVGRSRLSPARAAQRRIAVRWLAALHVASARLARRAPLPDRGQHGYLEMLRDARRMIAQGLSNSALTGTDRELLQGVITTCDEAEAGWERIASHFSVMPVTLVHGDFRPKNLYLRQVGEERVLLPIDWEYAGWGTPALDLGTLLRDVGRPRDLALYGEALGELAPPGGARELQAWMSAGRVLRAVTSIHWASTCLSFPYLEKPVHNLTEYRVALERAFVELDDPAPIDGGGA